MPAKKTMTTTKASPAPKAAILKDGGRPQIGSMTPTGTLGDTTRRMVRANPLKEYVSGGSYYWLTQYLRTMPQYIDDVTRDFGDDLYDRMMMDAKVAQCVEAVRYDALSQGLTLQPAVQKGDPGYKKAVEIRDFCQQVLDAMETPLIEEVLDPLMDAIAFGNSIAEKIYHVPRSGPLAGYMALKAIKHKPRTSFAFVVDAYNNIAGILGRRPDAFSPMLVEGALVSTNLPNFLPRDKFVIARFRPRGGDPRGRSLLRPAYTPWWLKQQGFPGYLKFMAQWASPSLVGTTAPDAGPEEKLDAFGAPVLDDNDDPIYLEPTEVMASQLAAFQAGSYMVVPAGSTVMPIEVAGQGAPFAEFNGWADSQIELAITLQALATSEGEHMSRAAAGVHQDTMGFAVQVVKGTFERMVEREILRQLVELNFGEKYLWLTPTASLSETEQHDFPSEGKVVADLWENGYLDVSQLPDTDARLGLPERSEQDIEIRQQKALAVAQQEIATANQAMQMAQSGAMLPGASGPNPPMSPGGAGPGGPSSPAGPGGAGGGTASQPPPVAPPPASGDPDPAAALGGYVPSLADTQTTLGAKPAKGEEGDDAQTVIKLLQDAGINPTDFIKQLYTQGNAAFSLASMCRQIGVPLALFGLDVPSVARFSVVDETNGHYIHMHGHSIFVKGAQQVDGQDAPASSSAKGNVLGEVKDNNAGGLKPMKVGGGLTTGPAPMTPMGGLNTGPAPMQTAQPAPAMPSLASAVPHLPAPGAPATPTAQTPAPVAPGASTTSFQPVAAPGMPQAPAAPAQHPSGPVAPEHVTQALQIAGPKISNVAAAKLKQLVNNGTIAHQEALHHTLAIATAINEHHTSQPGNNPHAQISPYGIEVAAKIQHIPTLLAAAKGTGEADPGIQKLAKKLEPHLVGMMASEPAKGHVPVNHPGTEAPVASSGMAPQPAAPAPAMPTATQNQPVDSSATAPAAETKPAKPAGAPDGHEDLVADGWKHSQSTQSVTPHWYSKQGAAGKQTLALHKNGKWEAWQGASKSTHDDLASAKESLDQKNAMHEAIHNPSGGSKAEAPAKPAGAPDEHDQLVKDGWTPDTDANGPVVYKKGEKKLFWAPYSKQWKAVDWTPGSPKAHYLTSNLQSALEDLGEGSTPSDFDPNGPVSPAEHKQLTGAGWAKASGDANHWAVYSKNGKHIKIGSGSGWSVPASATGGGWKSVGNLSEAIEHHENKAADKAPDGAPAEHNDLVGAGWDHLGKPNGSWHKYKHPSGKVSIKYHNYEDDPWEVSSHEGEPPVAVWQGDHKTLGEALKKASSLHTPEHDKLVADGWEHTGGNLHGGGIYKKKASSIKGEGDILSHHPGQAKEWKTTDPFDGDVEHDDAHSAISHLGWTPPAGIEKSAATKAKDPEEKAGHTPSNIKRLEDAGFKQSYSGGEVHYKKGSVLTDDLVALYYDKGAGTWSGKYDGGAAHVHIESPTFDGLVAQLPDNYKPKGASPAPAKPAGGDLAGHPDPAFHEAITGPAGWKPSFNFIPEQPSYMSPKGDIISYSSKAKMWLATPGTGGQSGAGDTPADAFAAAGITPGQVIGAPAPAPKGAPAEHAQLVKAGWTHAGGGSGEVHGYHKGDLQLKFEDYTAYGAGKKWSGIGNGKFPKNKATMQEVAEELGLDPGDLGTPATNPNVGVGPDGNPAAHDKLLKAGFEHAGTGSFHTYVKRYGDNYHTLGHSANAAKKSKDQWIATTDKEVKSFVPLKDALAHVGEDPEAVLEGKKAGAYSPEIEAKLVDEGWHHTPVPKTNGHMFTKTVDGVPSKLYWSGVEQNWQGEVQGKLPLFKGEPNFDTAYETVTSAMPKATAPASKVPNLVEPGEAEQLRQDGWKWNGEMDEPSYSKGKYIITTNKVAGEEEEGEDDSLFWFLGVKSGTPEPDEIGIGHFADVWDAWQAHKAESDMQDGDENMIASPFVSSADHNKLTGAGWKLKPDTSYEKDGYTIEAVEGDPDYAEEGDDPDQSMWQATSPDGDAIAGSFDLDEVLQAVDGEMALGAKLDAALAYGGPDTTALYNYLDGKKLADSNTNAPSHNKKIQALQEAVAAKDADAILNMPFGSNTYAKKQVAAANRMLKALGVTDKKVVPGQKAGTGGVERKASFVRKPGMADEDTHNKLLADGWQYKQLNVSGYYHKGELSLSVGAGKTANKWTLDMGPMGDDHKGSSVADVLAKGGLSLGGAAVAMPQGAATPKVHETLEAIGWKFKVGINSGNYYKGSTHIMQENDGTWSLDPGYGTVYNATTISKAMADAGEDMVGWKQVMDAEGEDMDNAAASVPAPKPATPALSPTPMPKDTPVHYQSVQNIFTTVAGWLASEGWDYDPTPFGQEAHGISFGPYQQAQYEVGTKEWVYPYGIFTKPAGPGKIMKLGVTKGPKGYSWSGSLGDANNLSKVNKGAGNISFGGLYKIVTGSKAPENIAKKGQIVPYPPSAPSIIIPGLAPGAAGASPASPSPAPSAPTGIYSKTGDPAPKPTGHWEGIPDVALPDGPGATGTPAKASGIILLNPDGKVWIRKVSGAFGGYEYSFAKGQVEPGLTEQQNAHKELYEEMGLEGTVDDVLGTFKKTTGTAKYFIGTKTGGDPSKFEFETESVHLVTLNEAENLLNHPSDKEVLAALKAHLAAKKASMAPTFTLLGAVQTDSSDPVTPADITAAKAQVSSAAQKYIDQAQASGLVKTKGQLGQFLAIAEAASKSEGKDYISGYGMKHAIDTPTILDMKEKADAGNAQAKAIVAKLGPHTFKTGKEKWAELTPDDILHKKGAVLGGSNSATLYETPSGEKNVVKAYGAATQAHGEALANKMLSDLGIGAPTSTSFSKGGKHYHATQYDPNLKTVGLKPTKEQATQFLKSFAANAMLTNWDAIGMTGDNLMTDGSGKLVQIDNGGALLHSAMGDLKAPDQTNDLYEWRNLAPGGINPAFAKYFKAAGIDSPDKIPGIINQINQVVALGKNKGGWDKYVADAIPQADKATQDKLSQFLAFRSMLLAEKGKKLQEKLIGGTHDDIVSNTKTFDTEPEVIKYFDGFSKKLKASLTKGQIDSIKWWQALSSSGIHSGAAGYGSVTSHMLHASPDVKANFKTLGAASQNAMIDLQNLFLHPDAAVPDAVALARSLVLNENDPEDKAFIDAYKDADIGHEFLFGGPQSAQYISGKPDWPNTAYSTFAGAPKWQLIFYCPPGTGLAMPTSFSGTGSSEDEVLVGPNARYRVIKPTEQGKDGRWRVHLQVIGYDLLEK